MKKKKAFTLAELLITLTIVGAVATLTIPPIVQNIQNTQIRVTYKSEFSKISQATQRLIMDNGGTLIGVFDGNDQLRDKYCNYLNCIKKCEAGNAECWTAEVAEWTAILPDGTLLAFDTWGDSGQAPQDCDLKDGFEPADNIPRCGRITIDVNGFKGPNVVGKDRFPVIIRKDSLVPDGVPKSVSYGLSCTSAGGDSCSAKYLMQ